MFQLLQNTYRSFNTATAVVVGAPTDTPVTFCRAYQEEDHFCRHLQRDVPAGVRDCTTCAQLQLLLSLAPLTHQCRSAEHTKKEIISEGTCEQSFQLLHNTYTSSTKLLLLLSLPQLTSCCRAYQEGDHIRRHL